MLIADGAVIRSGQWSYLMCVTIMQSKAEWGTTCTVCILLTSSLSVRYGFIKSGDFSVIPSSCDI